MQSRKTILLSTTMVPLIVFAGVVVGGAMLVAGPSSRPALAQCAPKKKVNPCAAAKSNPCAGAKPNPCAAAKCNPCAAACNPCNPCAAAKCNPCNPCAAAKCNPCNPCAAAKCNPCNPCAAAACSPCGAGKKCVVPRLQAAAACNPCAAAKCNPCNPCNPCAAAKCNPCNPCNPCAAAKCNPCNPCNPCAAAKCNPCNPCNPCAAGGTELTDAEAVAAYDCLVNEMKAAYAKSGNDIALSYASWPRYSKQSYLSDTHGGRYVQNYANAKARAYGAFENAGPMPSGAALAKNSFGVKPNGRVSVGPLFLMEKMNAGFNLDSGNWRYTMIMPNGSVFGTTGGAGGAKMQFCADCHLSLAPDSDSMLFLPEAYRVR